MFDGVGGIKCCGGKNCRWKLLFFWEGGVWCRKDGFFRVFVILFRGVVFCVGLVDFLLYVCVCIYVLLWGFGVSVGVGVGIFGGICF